MGRLIIFLLLLIASIWLGLVVARHPGSLFIVLQPWIVEMPLWFALLTSVIFLLIFYFIIKCIDSLYYGWFRIRNWMRFRREHKLYNKTQHGLTLLIEGRWNKAERLLLAGIHESVDPLMNYLGAAKAAQELGVYNRRDDYIKHAYQVAPNAALAIGLAQAELEFNHEQFTQAEMTLERLHRSSPRHPRVLKLLEKVYVRLADWSRLLTILPHLRKAKLLNSQQSEQFEKNIYCELLQARNNHTLYDIQAIWNDLPRRFHTQPDVVLAYVKQLSRFPAHQENEVDGLIRKTLKYQWQPELASIYGTLPFVNLNRQLVIVGAWLKMYGEKPELLLTLGRLCARIQLWGKAKDYFERCLALSPNTEASLAYGQLLEELDKPEEALIKYRDGLANIAHLF
jgi:HemY protein